MKAGRRRRSIRRRRWPGPSSRAWPSRARERSVGIANPIVVLGFRLLPAVFDLAVTPLMKLGGLSRRPLAAYPGTVLRPEPGRRGGARLLGAARPAHGADRGGLPGRRSGPGLDLGGRPEAAPDVSEPDRTAAGGGRPPVDA